MDKMLLYPAGSSESCGYASRFLKNCGISLVDHPTPEITHLLLDIPGYDAPDLKAILRMLPEDITVIGGKLNREILKGYRKIDLLQDPLFLARNAAITAECALQAAAPYIKTTFADTPALILGWGRIGKCLAALLSAIGCPVTVAARKESDLAMLSALGYRAVDFSHIPQIIGDIQILFNTAPNLKPDPKMTSLWNSVVKIDLASYPGLEYEDVIPARGLPGKYAPESAGKLIAESILRISKEE